MRRWDGAAQALGLHWLLLLWRASLRKVIRTIHTKKIRNKLCAGRCRKDKLRTICLN